MDGSASELIPVTRPTLPDIARVQATVAESYQAGMVTTGAVVRLFEEEIEKFTGAKHAVAVSDCTSGLILAFAAHLFPRDGEVIVPSFTFSATVLALIWNRLTPVYVDCLAGSMTVDPEEALKAISAKTVAIYPAGVFGLPPDYDALTEISERYGIPLIFDSAQGLGSTYKDRRAGVFGRCEVFSLSPTKVVTAIEGGMVTTNDSELAGKLQAMRDYGKGPDGEDMLYNGLSARMSELHAAVGLLSVRDADALIAARHRLIRGYRGTVSRFRGCRVQETPSDRTSTGNYFSLRIGPDALTDRDGVARALAAHNIQTKRYYVTPVHMQTAFRNMPHRIVGGLLNTLAAARESLVLPLYSHMTDEQQDRVSAVLSSVLTNP
ncbi:MAG: DegT/DnrJ/EryC1/StrS family aminotransferase [Deltaproteobacteria bacterium]|nr:DegT/DnrJ/EryC1/StrS family aminotransferase [Deltaproteobacteria bacterium]